MISQALLLDTSPSLPTRALRRATRAHAAAPAALQAVPLPLDLPPAQPSPAWADPRAAAEPAPRSVPAALDARALLRDVVRDTAGVYTLPASGALMRDAHLADGDMVMLQRADIVGHGELAAVRVKPEGATMLRRVYFENGGIRLQPESHRAPAAVVARDAVEIQGRVIAIVRRPA